LSEKFDYIILPPDAFHMTLRDRFVDARQHVQDALDAVSRIKKSEDRVVVKYRSKNQQLNFMCDAEALVGYGTLLDLCSEHTIVIGFPGSAMLECLLNDIRFFPFWDYRLHQQNRYFCMDAVQRLIDTVHVARSGGELYDNLVHQRVYKPGRSKTQLLHQNGIQLHRIVDEILTLNNKINT